MSDTVSGKFFKCAKLLRCARLAQGSTRGGGAHGSMSKVDFSLAVGAFVILTLAAWRFTGWLSTEPAIVEKDGEIEFYLGNVVQGAKVTRVVPIRNRTKNRLRITGLVRSCSCLDVQLDRMELEPQETANMRATLTVPARQGGFRVDVEVAYEGDQPSTLVRFLGSAAAWIQEDLSTLDFEEVCAGEATRQSIRLRVGEDWPADQRRVKCNMDYARVENIVADANGRQIECIVAFAPPCGAAAKLYHGELAVMWVGNDARLLSLPCRARVVSEWVSDPPQVVLGSVPGDQPAAFKFRIQNRKRERNWLARCHVIPQAPPGSLELTAKFSGNGWTISGTIFPRKEVAVGAKRIVISVLAPGENEVFSVPVFWETPPGVALPPAKAASG